MKKSFFYICSALAALTTLTASAQVDLNDPANAEFRDEVEAAFSNVEQQGLQPDQPVRQTTPERQPDPQQPTTPRSIGNFQPGDDDQSGNFGQPDNYSTPRYLEDDDCPAENRVVQPYVNHYNPNDRARKTAKGIVIVGSGKRVRAFGGWGSGGSSKGANYAEVANKYYRTFGGKVNVYVMPIPSNGEFYTPDMAKSWTGNGQLSALNNIYAHLDPEVHAVDAYTALSRHVAEGIYSRTDHHWMPLGAFYAARQFAKVAGVPFRGLDSYDERVVHRFLGTMYTYYTKDPELRNNPEDFIYYVPRDVDYKTTYINYSMKGQTVVGASAPKEGQFFHSYKDGSSGAYCTFMGGDAKITKVETSTSNGRRLLILKDSFGNALPGYFFYSFEQIHVVDSRYFKKNIVKYIEDNQITDVLFCNCIGFMCDQKISSNLDRYLTQ